MNENRLRLLRGFYENELINNFLFYWLPRCEDPEYGGFVNCFTNDGKTLMSRDKYCWSQGRFVWMFAKLAILKAPVFSNDERAEFLRLAHQGAAFLMDHCLLPGEPMRCAFLLEADGTPKYAAGCDALDASIYADCFVVAGLAKYAEAAEDEKAYSFAKDLYRSILLRIQSGSFHTLPYPLSPAYRAHGVPMILENVSAELYYAAKKLDPVYCDNLLGDLESFTGDILDNFQDENGLIREVIRSDGTKLDRLLGQHINPGHTIEDVWFMLDSARLTGRTERLPYIYRIAKQALQTGWDEEHGGLLHFAGLLGGKPEGDNSGLEEEPMSRQLADWAGKLWWVHSEALYTTLRCTLESGDETFWNWHEKVFAYTYATFPNRDPNVREWIQIRDRDGQPMNKVVALPVKDPYHVVRNLALILELLYKVR